MFFPLDRIATGWAAKAEDTPLRLPTGVACRRVLRVVVETARVLKSRERAPILLQLEVLAQPAGEFALRPVPTPRPRSPSSPAPLGPEPAPEPEPTAGPPTPSRHVNGFGVVFSDGAPGTRVPPPTRRRENGGGRGSGRRRRLRREDRRGAGGGTGTGAARAAGL